MYKKQTKHKINTRAKNHSYGGLGLEEGFRYIGKTFKASADPQARCPERERERDISLITMSGRLFLGVVQLTVSDGLERPRTGLGSEEGLLPPSENFSCLWKSNIAIRARSISYLELNNSFVAGLPASSLLPRTFLPPASLLSLRHDVIMPPCCFKPVRTLSLTFRCPEFPSTCLLKPMPLCTPPRGSNHLNLLIDMPCFPCSLASAFIVSIEELRKHVKTIPRDQVSFIKVCPKKGLG